MNVKLAATISLLSGWLLLSAIRVSGQSKVERSPEPVGDDAPAIRVSGMVVNPSGKPIADATVILRAKIGGQLLYPTALSHNRDVLARTTTDASGRFAFDKIGLPLRLADVIGSLLREEGGVQLLAWADGMGLAWRDAKGLKKAEPVRLTLAPEAKVIGVVRDQDGRGLSDVTVEGFPFTRRNHEDNEEEDFRTDDLNLSLSEVSLEVRTDAEGRFALRNMPADHRIGVIFKRLGLARKYITIGTGKESKNAEAKVRSITMEPQRYVPVRVVDHAGKPVGLGAVGVIDSDRHFAGKADVDKTGEAQIALSKPGRLEFYYETDPLQPRLNILGAR